MAFGSFFLVDFLQDHNSCPGVKIMLRFVDFSFQICFANFPVEMTSATVLLGEA